MVAGRREHWADGHWHYLDPTGVLAARVLGPD